MLSATRSSRTMAVRIFFAKVRSTTSPTPQINARCWRRATLSPLDVMRPWNGRGRSDDGTAWNPKHAPFAASMPCSPTAVLRRRPRGAFSVVSAPERGRAVEAAADGDGRRDLHRKGPDAAAACPALGDGWTTTLVPRRNGGRRRDRRFSVLDSA